MSERFQTPEHSACFFVEKACCLEEMQIRLTFKQPPPPQSDLVTLSSVNLVKKGQGTHPADPEPQAPADAMPLRIGSEEDFGKVRDCLRALGFNEGSITAALKISDISHIPMVDTARMELGSIPAALAAFIEFFIFGHAIAEERLRASCGEESFAALVALDLVRNARGQEAAVACPVWLYPVRGFLIASDRRTSPAGEVFCNATEVVFPAHDAGTLQFLRLMPVAAGSDALDLCGGSGIGALQLARNGNRATTADVTARSAHFAKFNAMLNGIAIEILQGDLYAPIDGRSFDLITSHPPWVPSTGDAMVFRDGGESGDAIAERVFAGLPRHLRPGGTAVVVSLGRDGRDCAYEQRVRRWLGDGGRDCDVILGVNKPISIDEMADSMRQLHLGGDAEKAQRIAARLRDLGTEKFVHGAVFVRRTTGVVSEPPLRLRMFPEATAAGFERIFAWRERHRLPDFADWLAAARPHLSDSLEITYRYGRRESAVVANLALLSTRRPITASIQLEAWVGRLLERLDGLTTVAEAFEVARQARQTPGDFTLAAFVGLVDRMVERGILDVDLP